MTDRKTAKLIAKNIRRDPTWERKLETPEIRQRLKMVVDNHTVLYPLLQLWREGNGEWVAFIELPLETMEFHLSSRKESNRAARDYLRIRYGKQRLHCISEEKYEEETHGTGQLVVHKTKPITHMDELDWEE